MTIRPLAPTPAELLRLSARFAFEGGESAAGAEEAGPWPGGERLIATAGDRLLEMAAAHAMRPLLYRFLERNKLSSATKVYSTLRDFTRQNLRENMRMTGELILLLRLFAGRGINAIPYKGPTLAALAYGDLGLREFGDLDLLIAGRDFAKAQELLIERGYRPEAPLSAKEAAAFVEACNVMAFWHAGKEISVELHWELSPKYLPFSPDLERLRERMVPSYPGGHTVMTLSPEDLLVYLCAHGAKHVWEKLIWVVDVAGLIRERSNLDWDRIYDLSVEQRCERVLFLGLRLARDVIGVSSPPEIEKLVEGDGESGRLAAIVTERLFSDSGVRRAHVTDGLFIFRLRRGPLDKIRSFVRMAITPSAADWLFFPNLPKRAWMYPLLRPLRLIAKLASRR